MNNNFYYNNHNRPELNEIVFWLNSEEKSPRDFFSTTDGSGAIEKFRREPIRLHARGVGVYPPLAAASLRRSGLVAAQISQYLANGKS